MESLLEQQAATVSSLEQDERRTLVQVCQALLDHENLRILGLLANKPRSLSALASELQLSEQDLFQRMGRLRWLELVRVQVVEHRLQCSLNPKMLQQMTRELGKFSKEVFARDREASAAAAEAGDTYERKVLQNFFRGEHLVSIPVQPKKLMVVLKWLANRFDPGVRYTEKQINTELLRYNRDSATLRRALIDARFMARENGIYWRLEDQQQ